MILETQRLILRKMDQGDWEDLCKILQDPEVMYAYEHAFSDQEVQQWLDNQRRRYCGDGFGLWAMVTKADGRMIGQAGLTMQPVEERQVVEIGYLLQRAYWGKGYATEAAIGCKRYAFERLGIDEVYSIIRDSNIASQRVAERNGMIRVGLIHKFYYQMDMPHYVYCVKKSDS